MDIKIEKIYRKIEKIKNNKKREEIKRRIKKIVDVDKIEDSIRVLEFSLDNIIKDENIEKLKKKIIDNKVKIELIKISQYNYKTFLPNSNAYRKDIFYNYVCSTSEEDFIVRSEDCGGKLIWSIMMEDENSLIYAKYLDEEIKNELIQECVDLLKEGKADLLINND